MSDVIGAFGNIYKGTVTPESKKLPVEVAVKTIKSKNVKLKL